MYIGKVIFSNPSARYSIIEIKDKRFVADWKHVKNRFPQMLEVGERVRFRCSKSGTRCIRVLTPEEVKAANLTRTERKERKDFYLDQKDERERIEKLRVERRTNDIRKFAEADTSRSAVVEDFLASRRERRRTGNGEPE